MVSVSPGAVKTEYVQVIASLWMNCHGFQIFAWLSMYKTMNPQDKIMGAETANPMKAVFEKGKKGLSPFICYT